MVKTLRGLSGTLGKVTSIRWKKRHDDQRDNLKNQRSATSLYVTQTYYTHCNLRED